jgi:hypothetical protein
VSRSDYYNGLKANAREVRTANGWDTLRITVTHFRTLYAAHGITLHYWPPPHVRRQLRDLRGAYFLDEYGATVMVARHLPNDPKIFTLGHEFKHHLRDGTGERAYCAATNEHDEREIGAEVFAAELIFPEDDFRRLLVERGVRLGGCTQEDLVRLKHDTETPLSHASLRKRACFLGFGEERSLPMTGWNSLRDRLYGPPVYRLLGRGRGRARRREG